MRGTIRRVLLSSAVCLSASISTACYESAFPLDATPQADFDARLLGTWHCVTPDPGDRDVTLTVASPRNRIYPVTLQEFDQELDRYEGHASVVAGVALVNLRDVKPSAKPWTFVRYSLLRPTVLQVQVVTDAAMQGIDASPVKVRQAIEQRMNDDALFAELCTCTRMNSK